MFILEYYMFTVSGMNDYFDIKSRWYFPVVLWTMLDLEVWTWSSKVDSTLPVVFSMEAVKLLHKKKRRGEQDQ
jgi:hypothetical protein